jgi:propionate CoA-transferase
VALIQAAVEQRCQAIGHKVAAVVNYDGFQLDDTLADAYAQMVHEVEQRHYTRVSRYASTAFKRMRLAQVLTRTVAPAMFEDLDSAAAYAKSSAE